ncbi:MAG TPA: response regulator [Chthoniobacterales bacterium]|nr:response regulator [Chthoniobacterales bacterium]
MTTSNEWYHDSADVAKMKILIIDDEPLNVELLKEILLENGYTNIEALTDSKVALETCTHSQPDLILLDLMMPPPDGFAVLDSLRADYFQTFLPIIALTADTTGETRRRALDAGATDFLTKPFDHTEVVLRIRNLLRTVRAHRLLDNQRAAFEDALRERTSELRATILELQRARHLPLPEKPHP